MSITITHTPSAGTLLDGTSRGDGINEILKAHGWKWGRGLGKWYVPQSRDNAPQLHIIEETAKTLTAANHTVQIQIDQSARSMAEVEADRDKRASQRAQHLQEVAERKAHAANEAEQAFFAAHRRLPAMGEPVKAGHHSESRHLQAIDKANTAWKNSVEADQAALQALDKAESAKHATGARNSPQTVANRIEKLTAQMRQLKRSVDGYTANRGTLYERDVPPVSGEVKTRTQEEMAALADQIQYWQSVQREHINAGRIGNYCKDSISPGDYVLIGPHWHQVLRANAKTVSVDNAGRTGKAPYSSIKGHQKAEPPADQLLSS
ncbi:hypothetical protein AOZ07_01475 [Glutamicibacter halophytocola]|uniref:DUF3560 domain-containing protein n=1 Tax=Glutamicibacter halophytocola TaxID=1933880 RepID=UPI0006D4A94D|nr:DUF3560 domain-containing protein [Glutamicibacter halophytocola]ALG27798.1 hypothetical protein AOZ07_01475 [Glutamicibacter halophytocola]